MKTINYILSFIAIVAIATSCQKEINAVNQKEAKFTLKAESPNDDKAISKVSINGLDVAWTAGDILDVGLKSNLTAKKLTLEGVGGVEGLFTGDLTIITPGSLYAVYEPIGTASKIYTTNSSSGEMEYTFTLPALQVQTHDHAGRTQNLESIGDYAYLYGKSTSEVSSGSSSSSITMNHLMSIVDFNIVDIDEGAIINTVIYSGEKAFSPTAKVNFDNGNITFGATTDSYLNAIQVELKTGNQTGYTVTGGKLTVSLAMFPQTFKQGVTNNITVDYTIDGIAKSESFAHSFESADKTFEAGKRESSPYYSFNKELEQISLAEENIRVSTHQLNDGSIAGMLDGDVSTFFTSHWNSYDITVPQWIVVDLGEGNEMNAIGFKYTTRNRNNTSYTPSKVVIQATNESPTDHVWTQEGDAYTDSDRTWISLNTYDGDINCPKGDALESPALLGTSDTKYRYWRFYVDQAIQSPEYIEEYPNAFCFNISELKIFRQTNVVYPPLTGQSREVTMMNINIWQEGTSVLGGYNAIVNEIAHHYPDFVALSEVRNYGSVDFTAKLIADLATKGKVYYSRKSQDSGILSRYPITSFETIYPYANDSGSAYKLTTEIEGVRFAAYTAHLDYKNYASFLPRGYSGSFAEMAEPIVDLAQIQAENLASKRDDGIKAFIADAKSEIARGAIVMIGGDFNEPSHLDWTIETKDLYDHNGVVYNWDVSMLLQDAGYIDSYRKLYSSAVTHPGFTYPSDNVDITNLGRLSWAPKADERDRIDFIHYYPDSRLTLLNSSVYGPKGSIVRNKRVEETTSDPFIIPLDVWPTDHKGVISTFRFDY